MYLRRLEIAGFKSFGSRVKLDFRPGISAIVGPNGSGKSNVAEAIRWVMGEQNVRSLRLSKTEDLIYTGSDAGKAQASMAEVIMTLEGEKKDARRKLDFSELVISRRLYRSGESEYRLAGKPVRVKDLQKILTQVGFGASSYAVVGQGMIETLLIASPAERKLLFEEASGIRAFELERTNTLRKLQAAREQSSQLEHEVALLTPEKDALGRQVDQLNRLRSVQEQLVQVRTAWLWQEQHQLAIKEIDLKSQLTEAQARVKDLTSQVKVLEKEAQTESDSGVEARRQQSLAIQKLEDLDVARTKLAESIANAQAQRDFDADQAAASDGPKQARTAIAQIELRIKQLKSYLDELSAKNAKIEEKIAVCNTKIDVLNSELTKYRHQLNANQRDEHLSQALGLARLLSDHLQGTRKIENIDIRKVVHKLIRMVKLAHDEDMASLPGAIAKLQQNIARELGRREDIVEKQTTEIIKMRSVELDINALEKELEIQQARLATLEDKLPSPKQVSQQRVDLDSLLAERERLDRESRDQRELLATFSSDQATAIQVELAHKIEHIRNQISLDETKITTTKLGLEACKAEHAEILRHSKEWEIVLPSASPIKDSVSLDDIRQLEAELHVLGELDSSLVEAHQELVEKVSYMQSQAQDLQSAASDLEEVLSELERRIKKDFETNFAKINAGFGRHFAKLFNGGTASLKLIPGDDDTYGIEITAKPPGKRVELLTSLSGGEKAMAAIALLAAILEVNPSPFIVLDEVDAALDDANSAAFTSVLRELGKHSQLLVITHNHETMVQADELFGITSSTKMSSVVIAVDLRQAEALSA